MENYETAMPYEVEKEWRSILKIADVDTAHAKEQLPEMCRFIDSNLKYFFSIGRNGKTLYTMLKDSKIEKRIKSKVYKMRAYNLGIVEKLQLEKDIAYCTSKMEEFSGKDAESYEKEIKSFKMASSALLQEITKVVTNKNPEGNSEEHAKLERLKMELKYAEEFARALTDSHSINIEFHREYSDCVKGLKQRLYRLIRAGGDEEMDGYVIGLSNNS